MEIANICFFAVGVIIDMTFIKVHIGPQNWRPELFNKIVSSKFRECSSHSHDAFKGFNGRLIADSDRAKHP